MEVRVIALDGRWLRNPLFFAFVLPMLTDLSLTLGMQGPAYWHDYRQVTEGSPLVFLLRLHPVVYICCALLYLVAIYWLTAHLRDPFNVMLTCMVFAGHIWGSSTWIHSGLVRGGHGGGGHQFAIWGVLVLYYVVAGSCAGLALSAYAKQHQRLVDERSAVARHS